MDAPIEPTVTVDDIVAAVDALLAEATGGEDIVFFNGPNREVIKTMPAPTVPPAHVTSLPAGANPWKNGNPWATFGQHTETPSEQWGEDARHASIRRISICLTSYILNAGATAYHVEKINMCRRDTLIEVYINAWVFISGGYIEPTVTVEQFVAALDARITATVAQGKDLVFRCDDKEHRMSMPATAPTHSPTMISPGFDTGKRFEAPLEKWDEAALLSGMEALVASIALHILVSGGATYHVERVTLTTGHRQDRDWVDFAARVVVSKRATTANTDK